MIYTGKLIPEVQTSFNHVAESYILKRNQFDAKLQNRKRQQTCYKLKAGMSSGMEACAWCGLHS